MSTALTIRHLDPVVKHRLRQRAALHHRSMEAEARAILAASLAQPLSTPGDEAQAVAERRQRLAAVVGIWKGRGTGATTDELMHELRGDA